MSGAAYDGTHIQLQPNRPRCGKKKKRIVIPIGTPLKAALDARCSEKAEGTILRNSFGEAWTRDGCRTPGARHLTKLGDADLHFHDLRGTAVTRLALSGCATPRIAAITGHSPREVDEILKLGGQAELAEQAIVKLVAAVRTAAGISSLSRSGRAQQHSP